jgi:hypothetical protein
MGETPLNASVRNLGIVTMVALVALRIGIGLHFYREGAAKIRDPKPYSAGFLGNAKGWLAPMFHNLVWDADGVARLDLEQTTQIWDEFHVRAGQRFDFDEAQQKNAQKTFETRVGQLNWFLDNHASEVEEYQNGLVRRSKNLTDSARTEVTSLKGQLARMDGDMASLRRDLVPPIDQLWLGYERDINAIATDEQRRGGPQSIPKPGRRFLDSESIDGIIRYFDVTIGVLLILGLFTRPTAIVGACFLASVIASQWPGSSGAVPVWPQFIEMLGLVVLAAFGAGQVAGLDRFLSPICRWCCRPKQGNES